MAVTARIVKLNPQRAAAVDFEKAIVWIKWLGTHKDSMTGPALRRLTMATDIKPIRSEADYDAAMEAVAALWGAASGTPEGDRLDVLATLIDAYETKHHAMDAPDPIEAIKFRMEQQGLTSKDLAACARGSPRCSTAGGACQST
ncbi:hypothetical protein [Tabrizicola sp.]|uniref:hypothetical protein n=1 Tax=Tabrizicola sp. TaxID=2005166 RepID=UPI00286BDD3F|nr:hypothetical protein [Tabrizicola sp.]